MIQQLPITTNQGRNIWIVDTAAEKASIADIRMNDLVFVMENNLSLEQYGGGSTWTAKLSPSTILENAVTAQQVITANAYKDGPSLSLTPGTWDLSGRVTVQSPANTAQRVTAKLWDGTTAKDAGQATTPAGGTGITMLVTIALFGTVTLAANATWKISATSTVASIIVPTPADNATGLTNLASRLQAVRVG